MPRITPVLAILVKRGRYPGPRPDPASAPCLRMDTRPLFDHQRHLAELEHLLLADLRRVIPDPEAREPIEQTVRAGFRRERRLSCSSPMKMQ